MTDWERVERLRGRGQSWDEIAADDRVEFKPPEGTEKPGLALKALYFQRRSRTRRQAKGGSETGGSSGGSGSGAKGGWTKRKIFRSTAFLGILVALAGAIPLLLSFELRLIVYLVPQLALVVVAAVGGLLLGAAFIAGSGRALAMWKGGVIAGVILGIVLAGVLASVSLSQGCPNLAQTKNGEPGPAGDTGWIRADNPVWSQGGAPVVFYLGSIACPYCSASSWALKGALLNVSSSMSGVSMGTSSSTDVYPNTPEVNFVSSSVSSTYISWDPHEGADDTQITVPNVGCPESAYVAQYNTQGGIPFVVVGGVFMHTGSLVNPALLSPQGTPYSPQVVASDLASCGNNPNQNAVCSAILPAQFWLEAYMGKADQLAGLPLPSVVTDPNSPASGDFQAIT